MAPPRKKPNDRKTRVVSFRVTEGQWKALERKAKILPGKLKPHEVAREIMLWELRF